MRRRSSKLFCVLASAAAAFAQTAVQPKPDEPPASIGGEVRDSVTGLPIERAHAVVSRFAGGNQEKYGTFTNAEGRFLITGIPAGTYILALDRTAYVYTPSGSQLKLDPGDKKDGLKLKLTPTGTVAGRVLDADGAPVESMEVTAESGGRGDRSTTTDDRGMFRLGGLRPGMFLIKARPESLPFPPEIRTDGTVEVHYAATYHPDALDAKSATRVHVGPATEVTGVDIRLVRTPIVRVSGRILGAPPGTQNVSVSVRQQGSMGGQGSQAKPDGTFEIWRLDPGKYTITANIYNQGAQMSSAPVEVEVGQSDIENLSLQVMEPADIKGTVEFDDEEARKPPEPPYRTGTAGGGNSTQQRPPAPPRRVMLRGPDGSMGVAPADLNDDGTFTLTRVQPGRYRVMITPPGVFVKSMRLGPAGFEGALLDLTNGAGGAALSLRVASAKGAVSGVVRDEQGPAGGLRVVMVEDTERGMAQTTMSKEDGSYTFNTVAPGKYKMFAADASEMAGINLSNTQDFDDIAEKIEIHDRETIARDLKRRPAPAK